ncbi:hypothetical protein KL906_003624 [Ogataea polymorpha]|nr:hypothetical protein KL908_003813 [Ogataea polymorpha]KAG7907543.1 hypothetical protein KL906_003624 [Ogataea polymorpha]
MLLEIASEIISRSILDEKVLRQEYGIAQPGLVDEGETAAGLVKKVRQNIGNSASGSSQSSAAATPQSGENGSIPDIGRLGFLQNGKEIFPKSANGSDAYFQTSTRIWLARAKSVHEPGGSCGFWGPMKNFRLVFGNQDDLGCSHNRKRKERMSTPRNLDWRQSGAGPDDQTAIELHTCERWLSSRSNLGHLGCNFCRDTVHGCEAEHAETRYSFIVFGSFQIQPPPN